MYYNGKTNVLEREETTYKSKTENSGANAYAYRGYTKTDTVTKRAYSAPTVNYISVETSLKENVKAHSDVFEDEDENAKPSKATMQYANMEKRDFIEAEMKSAVSDEKKYRINAKSMIFVAVYAIAVLTIFSLIILNAAMLKSVDNTIKQNAARIELLREENLTLNNELDFVRSDEVIISEAEKRGLN